MTIAVGRRVTLPNLAGSVVCINMIDQNASQTIGIDYMSCCIKKLDMCIAQNADKQFSMQDSSSVDFSSASEITFDIWESISGTSVLSKSLTGGDITLVNDYTFQFDVTNSESGAMSATRKYCEAWVTLSGGDRQCVGAGLFEVKDTRKHD